MWDNLSPGRFFYTYKVYGYKSLFMMAPVDVDMKAYCVVCGDVLTDYELREGWNNYGTYCTGCARSEGVK
jgi:hypothetical protein